MATSRSTFHRRKILSGRSKAVVTSFRGSGGKASALKQGESCLAGLAEVSPDRSCVSFSGFVRFGSLFEGVTILHNDILKYHFLPFHPRHQTKSQEHIKFKLLRVLLIALPHSTDVGEMGIYL